MNRFNNVDFTRAVAILAIIVCHYLIFGNIDGVFRLGGYMGAAGVFVFLALSSLLFGLRFVKKGPDAFAFGPFMTKRLLRLGASLWPFLIIMMLLYASFDVQIRLRNAILNFAFLGWFAKMPGLENLWYITMNVFLYIAFCLLVHLPKKVLNSKWLMLPSMLVAIVLEFFFDARTLPGYIFVILVYGSWIFIYAKEFLEWLDRLNAKVFYPVALIVNALAIYICYQDQIPYFDTIHRLGCDVAGFTWFVALLQIGTKVKVGKFLIFISGISYEMYLVHHIFCNGPFNVYKVTSNPALAFLMIAGGAFIFGYILHVVGDRLNKLFSSTKS